MKKYTDFPFEKSGFISELHYGQVRVTLATLLHHGCKVL